jgi:hypothetical protein
MPKMMPREVTIAMALELKLDGQNAATMKNQRMMFCFETNSAHPFATAAGLTASVPSAYQLGTILSNVGVPEH